MRLTKKFAVTLTAFCGLSLPLHAAEYNVNDLNDTVDMDGCNEAHCSLREAVLASNANLVDAENTINLTIAGTYTLSIPGYEDGGLEGDLDILSNLPDGALKTVSIVGLGADTTIIDASELGVEMSPDRVLHVPFAIPETDLPNVANLILQDLGVTGGAAEGNGGGVFVEADTATFTALTVNNCDIYDNEAINGGGIAILKDDADTLPTKALLVNNSLLRINTAGSNGGAIYLSFANAEINNSTITANGSDSGGAALYTFSDDVPINITFNSSTITANSQETAIVAEHAGTEITEIEFANTILSGNLGEPTECEALGENVSFVTNGYNIFGDLTGCTLVPDEANGDQIVVDTSTIFDPAGLADNGGPTQTFALLLDGEAVDAGNPAGCFNGNGDPADPLNTELLSDQRVDAALFPRISGAACDVGAFELRQEADISTVKTANAEVVQVGDNLTYTITVTNNGPAVANNISVVDALPAEVTFVSVDPADPICSFDNVSQDVECLIEKLLPNESEVITIVVTVNSAGNGVITNTATATPGNETDPDPSDNSGSVDTEVGGGGFLQGSGTVIGCSLNTLATAGSASWLWMMSVVGLFFASLKARRH